MRGANLRPGMDHPRSVLTDGDVLEIRKRYRSGEKQMSIARKFGVSQSLVSKIVSGQAWKHLPGTWDE